MTNRTISKRKPIGIAISSKDTKNFRTSIGSFIINFGFIEHATFDWIERLIDSESTSDKMIHELAQDMSFSKRIDLLNKIIDVSFLSMNLKRECKVTWNKAKKLSEFRNVLAHNPIAKRENKYGIMNLKDSRKTGSFKLIDLEELENKADESSTLSQEIHVLTIRIVEEASRREKGKN